MASNFYKFSKGLNLNGQPSEPAGNNGDIYYSTALNKFRQFKGGVWADIGDGSSSETSSTGLVNVGVATSVAANALTVALKQADGTSDPAGGALAAKIGFRSPTSASGAYNQRSVTGALSLVVPSGTTLGMISTIQGYLYLYALDNAGTVELAISLTAVDVSGVISTSAISGGNSGSVIYSQTARSNVPARLIARIAITEATAGTWATNASQVSLQPFLKVRVHAYYQASGAYTTGGLVRANFDSRIFDSHNAVTTGTLTWAFTAPFAGLYHVSVNGLKASVPGTIEAWRLQTAGLGATPDFWIGNLAAGDQRAIGSGVVYLPAGGQVWAYNGTGTTTNYASDPTSNWIQITSLDY